MRADGADEKPDDGDLAFPRGAVGGEHPPGLALRAGELQNQVAGLSLQRRAGIRIVKADRIRRRAGGSEFVDDELRDLSFFAALAGDGHELGDEFERTIEVGVGHGIRGVFGAAGRCGKEERRWHHPTRKAACRVS